MRSDRAGLAGQDPGTDVVFGLGRSDTREDGLFELVIGVDVDGVLAGGDGRGGIFTKIEAGFWDRLRGFPLRGAELPILALIGFFASGHQAEMLWPAKGKIVESKFGSVAVVRIPTFTSADIENAVARVGDDVAAIVKVKSEGCADGGSLWEEDAEGVVTASVKLLFRQAFILEEGKL